MISVVISPFCIVGSSSHGRPMGDGVQGMPWSPGFKYLTLSYYIFSKKVCFVGLQQIK